MKSHALNFFQTTLTNAVSDADTSFNVEDTGGVASPAYIVIDPKSTTKREVIFCDGAFTATQFTTTSTANRGLQGSVAGAQSHSAGTSVWMAPLSQHVSDLWDEVETKADSPHAIGGAAHAADTVANLESKLTGADLTAVVSHGASATVARPAAAKVHWYGTVNPDNAATDDLLYRTDEDRWYRWDGTTWDSGASLFLTDADATGLTWHEGNRVSVAGESYHTIFDIASAVELVGGSIHCVDFGMRLTVDGVVVFDRTNPAMARDSVSNSFGTSAVPAAKADSSMKLEVYNFSSDARDHGWRVVTR